MMTLGFREPVASPQGVGIKPTGHTLAPTRLVGLSTFPLATDPESAAISEWLTHFGLAGDFCSSSASSFLKSSRSRSGSRLRSVRNRRVAVAQVDGLPSRAIAWSASACPSAADTPEPSRPARPASNAWQQDDSKYRLRLRRAVPWPTARLPAGRRPRPRRVAQRGPGLAAVGVIDEGDRFSPRCHSEASQVDGGMSGFSLTFDSERATARSRISRASAGRPSWRTARRGC